MALGKKTGGRKPGTPNKLQKGVRESILSVAERLGGEDRLLEWTQEDSKNEDVFWSNMYMKTLPREIKAEIAATHVISNLTPEQQRGIAEAILLGK